MTKKLSESLSPKELAERKKNNTFFRTIVIYLRLIYEGCDLTFRGPMEHHFLDSLFILVHNHVIKEYGFPKDRWNSPRTSTPIPDELSTRLIAFLEDCATNKAAFYWRDWQGFVWEVLDASAYAQCCQRHGFSKTDYQIVWPKKWYDKLGRLKKQ